MIQSWDTTVTHNDDGTANGLGISAHHYPRLYGRNGAYLGTANIGPTSYDCDVIPRYPKVTQSVAQKSLTSIAMNWNSDSEVDYAWYSTNNGSSWVAIGSVSGTNGSYTITGLEPNTTYSIVTRLRRKDSQLNANSASSNQTTYDIARITDAPNITLGQNATIRYNNPGGAEMKAYIGFVTDGGSSITVVDERAVTGNQYTFQFTSSEIQAMYSKIPSAMSGTYRYILKTIVGNNFYVNFTDRTFYVDANTSKPAFGNFEYRDLNSITTALTQDPSIIIRGYNQLSVIVADYNKMSAQNGAISYSYTFKNGYNSSTFIDYDPEISISAQFDNIDTPTIEVIATDSRALSTSVVKTIPSNKWIEYEKHWVRGNSTISRIGGIGTTAIINLIVQYWNGSFGATPNTITEVKYKVIPLDSSDWDSASWTVLPSTAYSLSNGQLITNDTATITNLTVGTAYQAMFEIKDELSTATQILEISAGESLLSLNKTQKMVGVGKLPDKENLYAGSLDVETGVNVNDINYGGGFLSRGNTIIKEDTSDDGTTVVAGTGALHDTGGAIVFRPWHVMASVAEVRIDNINDESYLTADVIAGNRMYCNGKNIDFNYLYAKNSIKVGVMTEQKWEKICNLKFNQHNQGEFANLKIYIGDGNNGRSHQNAYINLTMQLGWTGENGGRAGCFAELYPLDTPFNTKNTAVKVIANSNIDYDIWFYTQSQYYCKPNYTGNVSEQVTITPKFELSTNAPTGTECELAYKVMALNSYSTSEQQIGTWIDNKPLYRRSIVQDNIAYNTANTEITIMTLSNVDNIIDIKGVLWNSAKTLCYQTPYTSTNNLVTRIYFVPNGQKLCFMSQDTWSSAKLVITVEYTKTTD